MVWSSSKRFVCVHKKVMIIVDEVLKKILDIKAQRGMSDQEFARALNLGNTAISDWKREKSASYRSRLPQIAECLGVEPTIFLNLMAKQTQQKRSAAYEKVFTKNALDALIANASKAISSNVQFEITFNELEISILKECRKLDKAGKKKVEDYIGDLIASGRYDKAVPRNGPKPD